MFLGITSETSANRDAIAGLGIGGAALFAAGTLAHNATYQQIYLAGSKAVGCAVIAARPLLVKREDYEVLQNALAALRSGDDSISGVETKIDAVRLAAENLRKVVPNAAPAAAADIRAAAAAKVVARAETAAVQGRQYLSRIAGAHTTIVQTVHNIRDSVSAEIIKNEPSLQSLAQLTGSLGRLGTGFGQVNNVHATATTFESQVLGERDIQSEVAKRVGNGANEYEADAKVRTEQENLKLLADHVEALRTAEMALAENVNIVADHVNDAEEMGQAVTSVEECEVEDIPGTFRIDPTLAQIDLDAGEEYTFRVSGGSGLPSASVVGKMVSGLTVDRSAGDPYMFTVKVAANTVDGEGSVLFQDGSLNNRQSVKVVVHKAEADLTAIAAKLKGKEFTSNKGSFAITEATADNAKKTISVKIEVKKKPENPLSKADMQDNVVIVSQVSREETPFKVEITNFKEIEKDLAGTPPQIAFGKLSEEDRIKVQKALCMPEKNPADGEDQRIGTYGPRTETAAKWFQILEYGEDGADGKLTEDQIKFLTKDEQPAARDTRCEATDAHVYGEFVSELSGTSLDLPMPANATIAIQSANEDLTDPVNKRVKIKVTVTLKPNGDEAKALAAAPAAILKETEADDYWIGPANLSVTK